MCRCLSYNDDPELDVIHQSLENDLGVALKLLEESDRFIPEQKNNLIAAINYFENELKTNIVSYVNKVQSENACER
jgi:hypothetical protein